MFSRLRSGPKRSPVPLTALTPLPKDILGAIADILQESSPETIYSLKLVNSVFNLVARYSQFKNFTLLLSAAHDKKVAQRLAHLESEGLLSAVRTVVIDDCESRKETPGEVTQSLVKFCHALPLMGGLQEVEYRGSSMPPRILASLQSIPHVALHTSIAAWSMAAEVETANLHRLHGNTSLHTLEVQVTYIQASDCREMMAPLKRLLLSCPNLRCLSLDVSQPSSGCVPFGPGREYCGLGFVNEERLPPLEALTLKGYPFGHEPGSSPSIVNTEGYPGKGDEQEYWAEVFDWSRLQRLSTQHGDLAVRLAPNLSALRSAEVGGVWEPDGASKFFLNVGSSLSEISAASLRDITLHGILKHSQTLRTLRIHRSEQYRLEWAQECMDLDSLYVIRDKCLLLENITLDLPRDGSWPHASFDALARLPRLKMLEIWFELGINDPENPVKPFATLDAAGHMFEYIRRANTSLQRLVVHSGAPPPLGYGFPSEHAFWPKYNSTSFVCEISERDDEAAAGKFSVTCPKPEAMRRQAPSHESASKAMIARIRRLLPNSKSGTEREGASTSLFNADEAWLVAHHGPIPRSEWKAHY